VVLPISWFSYNTKREIQKRQRYQKGILDEDNGGNMGIGKEDYIATSPQAVYDNNRNQRALEKALN
jgi:hypothetical protein